jgi:hypothetical protein
MNHGVLHLTMVFWLCRWPQDFQAVLVSAAEDADLMDPASWTVTSPLAFEPAWFADVQPLLPTGGYLEGAHLSCHRQSWGKPCNTIILLPVHAAYIQKDCNNVCANAACRLHAGNAVERPDGSVGLLMRMPRMQLDGAYFIDLNHACLLSFQPSAHFGLPGGRAGHSVAGGTAGRLPTDSGPHSSVMTDGDRQPSSRAVLPAAARRRRLHAMAAQAAGEQRRHGGRTSMHIAEPGCSHPGHGSRLRQQLHQRSNVGLSAGTLAFEQIVVSAEHNQQLTYVLTHVMSGAYNDALQ